MKKQRIFRWRHSWSFLFFILLMFCMGWSRKEAMPSSSFTPTPRKGFALLELFTSQGCSSCPPADALLAEYADQHSLQIIPLSFHVDYWDRLGWKDPFSSHANSERQEWYSGFLPRGQLYTPQLVVNGARETVGNNRAAVASLVQAALQEAGNDSLTIIPETFRSAVFRVQYHLYTALSQQEGVLQAALIKKTATTRISRGENEGRTVTNRNVVVQFSSVPLQSQGIIALPVPENFSPEQYAVVVFLQKKDGHITTASLRECRP
jgi:hypothetical protein